MRNDFQGSNYLIHSAKGTSWIKKGAKYLKRAWKNGKWVYYYTKQAQQWSYKTRDRNRMKKSIVNAAGEGAVRGVNTTKYKETYDKYANAQARARSMTNTYYNMALRDATEAFGKKGGQIITDILMKINYVSDKEGQEMITSESLYDRTSFGNKKRTGH